MNNPPEKPVKYTFTLVFSIIIAVFGNSFLYGYNIGVINSPALIIQEFYRKVYIERAGGVYVPPSTNATSGGVVDATASNQSSVVVIANNSNVAYVPTLSKENETAPDKVPDHGVDQPFIELMWALTVAIFVASGCLGSFLSGMLADKLGRKRGMIVITVIMFVAAIFGGVTKVAKSPECLIISRLFVGLQNGLNISLASLYLAEISPRKIRGAVGTCHQLFITIGILWSQILGLPDLLGTKDLWPWLFAFNAFPSLVCLICMPFCPESPRYLLIKKNEETAATEGLRKLRGYEDVEDEIEEMRIEAKKSQTVKEYSLKELLKATDLRLPVIIAVLIQVAQQLSGINAVMSYSSFIFGQAGIAERTIPYVVVGVGGINVVATIICVPLMEVLGRRPLLIFPMIGMAVSFVVLTIFLSLLNSQFTEQHSAFAIICIIAVLTYVVGFAVGLGPIPFIVVSEIFRQEPRAAAMSFSLSFNWICNFALMMTFRFIQEALKAYTYLIFVAILVASVIFIVIFVPETKNRTFDEISASIAFGRAPKSQPFGGANDEEMQPMGDVKA